MQSRNSHEVPGSGSCQCRHRAKTHDCHILVGLERGPRTKKVLAMFLQRGRWNTLGERVGR
eukprot:946462-Rhodomonas_salina.1